MRAHARDDASSDVCTCLRSAENFSVCLSVCVFLYMRVRSTGQYSKLGQEGQRDYINADGPTTKTLYREFELFFLFLTLRAIFLMMLLTFASTVFSRVRRRVNERR